ncbi:MAG: integrase [Flavobacteriaceae bacterium]|nr:MAG: integrase [Flavobacteriaceae bacterium]
MAIHAFLEYLILEKNYSVHTITAYRNDLENFTAFCVDTFERDGVEDASYVEIRTWIGSLVEDGLSNASVNRKVSSLKSYYKFLQRISRIDTSPLATHKSLKMAKRLHFPFSEKEITEVLDMFEGATDFESLRDKSMIEILYATGIRRFELLALKHKDVDFGEKTIKVLGKRNKERLIPLLDPVLKTLQQYDVQRSILGIRADYFFVTSKGKKMYGTFVYRVINKYFRAVSSKEKTSPHVLRHSFATHLLNEGADLNSVKELLGHSSLASTQVYTKVNLKKMKEVYNKAHPRGAKKNEGL